MKRLPLFISYILLAILFIISIPILSIVYLLGVNSPFDAYLDMIMEITH